MHRRACGNGRGLELRSSATQENQKPAGSQTGKESQAPVYLDLQASRGTHQPDQGHSQAGKKNYSRFSPEDMRGSMLMSGYFQKEEFRNEEK